MYSHLKSTVMNPKLKLQPENCGVPFIVQTPSVIEAQYSVIKRLIGELNECESLYEFADKADCISVIAKSAALLSCMLSDLYTGVMKHSDCIIEK